ncbi:hypothetical protein Tco_0205132 [Tanacetum coccineum]
MGSVSRTGGGSVEGVSGGQVAIDGSGEDGIDDREIEIWGPSRSAPSLGNAKHLNFKFLIENIKLMKLLRNIGVVLVPSIQQMMKGSDIRIQEKKAKLFNEWERFASTDGESIESYYHRDLDKIDEVNANCILMANLQQALTSGTQTDNAPVYDSNGSTEGLIRAEMKLLLSRFSEVVDSEETLQQAAKFVRDFQSLVKEADESLAKHKALKLEIERLLRAVVSQLIMSIMQNSSVVDTSNL